MTASRVDSIRRCLEQAFAPVHFELLDDSQSHAGHPGAVQSGGGHFYATIVSEAFEGKSLVARHRLVYQALGDLMNAEIHAFSMKVFSPSEYQSKGNP